MKKSLYLTIEFLLLFILLPVSLAVSYPIWIKATLIVLSFVYVIWVLLRKENASFKIKPHLNWKAFWRRTFVIFLVIALLTSSYVFFMGPEKLFYVPRHKPVLFIIILLVYSFLSVWPQELIYRTFFFSRYERFFKGNYFLIFINAVIFSLAHLFFKNTLVLVLTFLGGLLFGLTYLKTRSTLLVSIEHAIYGSWLFTVGMGQMLAFPGMDV